MIHAHQPGSQPIDIPEVIPNPAVVPRQQPAPKEPAPKIRSTSRRRSRLVRHMGELVPLGRLWLFFERAKLRP